MILPGGPPSLSRKGRLIVGNLFARIDRYGRIVKTTHDIEKERKGLVKLDSDSLTFESSAAELSRRNIKEAIDHVRLERLKRKEALYGIL